MDFIMVPLVIGIITLGIYKLFELFVRKQERLTVIDKIGDKLDPSFLQNAIPNPIRFFGHISTGALKAGCLLVGVGLGLLVGLFIIRSIYPSVEIMLDRKGYFREIASIVFGSSVLLFGGISLLVAFFVEMRFTRPKEK